MRVLREVASEIYSMFVGDAVMTIFVVAVVGVAAALSMLTLTTPILIGFGLLVACLVLLTARVFVYARSTRR